MMMYIGIIIAAILGAEMTYHAIHKYHLPTVRASSGSTLIFALIIQAMHLPYGISLQAAFFGATFVGMTDKSRLGWKRVLFASLVFAAIYIFLIPLAKGIGGSLGTAAFVSSSVSYLFGKAVLRKRPA